MDGTIGQRRVGAQCNPSGIQKVDDIKQLAAALIDMVDAIPADRLSLTGNEVGRWKSLAQTAIEEGAMWAVKAVVHAHAHAQRE